MSQQASTLRFARLTSRNKPQEYRFSGTFEAVFTVISVVFVAIFTLAVTTKLARRGCVKIKKMDFSSGNLLTSKAVDVTLNLIENSRRNT